MDRKEFARLVGDNVRRYRDEFHLTQAQFAEKTGISLSYCASIEAGSKLPSAFTLRKFSDALNIYPEYFLYADHGVSNPADERMRRINAMIRNCSPDQLALIEEIVSVCCQHKSVPTTE